MKVRFPLPSYVVTDLDVSTGIISDTYTSHHVAHQIHNGYSPINSDFLPTLKDLGVSELQVGYGGSGDSGEVMEVSCTNGNGEAVIIDDATHKKIEDLVYHLLEAHEPGWEINEGSDGDLTVDVETGAIKIEHNNNISETDTSSHFQLLSELGDDYTADLKAAHDELVAIMPEGMTLHLDYDWVGAVPDDVNDGITESWHNWTRFVRPENPYGDETKALTEQETEIALRFARPLITHLVEASYKDSEGTLIFNQDTGAVTIEDHIEHKDSEYRESRDRLITATVYDPSDEVDVMKPATPKM